MFRNTVNDVVYGCLPQEFGKCSNLKNQEVGTECPHDGLGLQVPATMVETADRR